MTQLVFGDMLPSASWKAPEIRDLPQDWSEIKRISLDVETKDPDIYDLGCGARRPGCHVAGFGIGFDLGPGNYRGYYLPVRQEGGGNISLDEVRRYLDTNLRTYKGRIVGGELSYDYDFMLQEQVRFRDDVQLHDVATNDSLIDEHQDKYDLDSIAKRHGLPGKDEKILRAAASFFGKNPKGVLYQLHSKYVGAYAEQDVLLPLQIDDAQAPLLKDMELLRASDLESEVLPVTVLMRRVGILIDQDALAQVEDWAIKTQHAFLAQFQHVAGFAVSMDDVRSPHAMQGIIKRLGLPPLPVKRRFNRRTKQYEEGQAEIKAETLKQYRDPRVDLLIQPRKLDKIITTYAPSIKKYMVNGRIHGTLKSVRGTREGAEVEDSDDQSGTVSGRFAHVHPNLGNQPNPGRDADDPLRVEMGTRWRRVFRPEHGKKWGLVDLSQQEPRWIVHDAEGMELHSDTPWFFRGAREMAEAFRRDKRTDNHDMITKITHLPRGPAKIAFLARCYGAGMAKLALQLEDKMRELEHLLRTDPGNKKVRDLGPEWPRLPDGWEPVHEDTYKPGDWIPPNKCVGDKYLRPDPACVWLIEKFDKMAPYVKGLSRFMQEVGKQRGYIKLIDGRRSRLKRMPMTGEYMEAHKMLNKRAQGNGAIQLKLALVALARAGLLPQMTVHDDVSRSVESVEELVAMKDIVENVIQYVPPDQYEDSPIHYKSRIPFLAKCKWGPSYGEADAADEIN